MYIHQPPAGGVFESVFSGLPKHGTLEISPLEVSYIGTYSREPGSPARIDTPGYFRECRYTCCLGTSICIRSSPHMGVNMNKNE